MVCNQTAVRFWIQCGDLGCWALPLRSNCDLAECGCGDMLVDVFSLG